MFTFIHNLSIKNYILFFTDLILIFVAAKLSCEMPGPGHPPNMSHLIVVTGVMCVVCQLFFLLNDLYKPGERKFFGRLFMSLAVSFLFLQIIFLSFPSLGMKKPYFEYTMALIFFLLFSWRFIFVHTLRKINLARKVAIIGTGSNARIIADELMKHKLKYELVGFVSNKECAEDKLMGVDVLGKSDSIMEIVLEHNIHKLVMASWGMREDIERRGDKKSIKKTRLVDILLKCKLGGVDVYEVHDFYERVTGKILLKGLRPSWIIFSRGFKQGMLNGALKRTLDVVLTLVVSLIAFPLSLVTALIIKIDEPDGPVLFKQERIGKNNEPFTLYKFRSMKTDAELLSGPVWADKKDNRVTRVGGFIRSTRLDELPQLINVLKGEMSLVGPRPERWFFIKQLIKEVPFYEERHTVKPGITGWAAVKFRYGSTTEDALEKTQYDLYYIKNISIFLDIKILFLTAYVMLSKQGSR